MATNPHGNNTRELLQTQLKLMRQKEQIMHDLPHLYGWPWYKWAKKFFDCSERLQLLCAANQISKSSTQIRKALHWATAQELWPKLWGRAPNQFWYLYPSKDVATAEYHKKWLPEFMPRGNMIDSAYYGWKPEMEKKHIKAIHFNNGVSIYFKTYAQNAKDLQSGSVYAMFCDEELPEDLYDELKFRLAGTRGYFHMVFTATLGQEMWWRALEAIGTDQELFPHAHKQQISMYDCLEYEDGSKSPWTVERIKEVEADCKSEAEVLRRVHGRFVKEEGRTYHTFSPSRHYVTPFAIPDNYIRYSGADIGSGGETGHPSSLVWVAVRPDYKMGYVYRTWRGDGIQTTSGDVLDKYAEMTPHGESFALQRYDWAAKDFGTISDRRGVGFTKASKGHDLGEGILNTLLRNDMLQIFDTDANRKLGIEMLNLQKSTPKNKAKDDLCDATRYATVDIPWDFTWIKGGVEEETAKAQGQKITLPRTKEEWNRYHDKQRQDSADARKAPTEQSWADELNADIAFWNEFAGN